LYKARKWEPYIVSKEADQYLPRFLEFNGGMVRDIIKKVFGLGYVFRLADLDVDTNYGPKPIKITEENKKKRNLFSVD